MGMPRYHGEAFQESQVLCQTFIIRRKEVGPVISQRLHGISQIEGVGVSKLLRQGQRKRHPGSKGDAILHQAWAFPVMSNFDF